MLTVSYAGYLKPESRQNPENIESIRLVYSINTSNNIILSYFTSIPLLG